MLLADIWPNLPENPTWLFILALAMVVGYFLLSGYTKTQTIEIDGLRKALKDQAERHAQDVSALNTKLDRLEAYNEEARSDRHRLRGELGKAILALDIVRNLKSECTCGVLHPLDGILDAFFAEQ